MRTIQLLTLAATVAGLLSASAHAANATESRTQAVGPQYDTAHVYVDPREFDSFVASLVATFGGTTSKKAVLQVTPTPARTRSQLVLTPAGTFSVFGFTTPIPYPFGQERTGYLVKDMDKAVQLARANGAAVQVATFPDPIGRDAIVQWPGGLSMQLYWHTVAPSYPSLQTIPENRVYMPPDDANAFIRGFLAFSDGKIVSDDSEAPGIEIGRPGETYRSVRIVSSFGKLTVAITDGHLPYPYGRETAGYQVASLDDTLAKARQAGVSVLVPPYKAGPRDEAIVQFPGGYIAEIYDSRVGKANGPT